MSDQTRPLEYWKRLPPAPMSPLGQKRKSALVIAMSAFPPIPTKLRKSRLVRFVPDSDIQQSRSPSILGYLARVAALARFSFESVGPIQPLLAWHRWVE